MSIPNRERARYDIGMWASSFPQGNERNKVDLRLKAVPLAVKNEQSPEVLDYAVKLIQNLKARVTRDNKWP